MTRKETKASLFFLSVIIFAQSTIGVAEEKKPEKDRVPTVRDFVEEVRHPKGNVVYHSPPRSHFIATKRAFSLLDANAGSCNDEVIADARQILEPMAFEVIRHEYKGAVYVIVREMTGAFRGGGVYTMRCGDTEPIVIQSPHGYFDLNTAKLGYRVFRRAKARWFMINSLQRYKSREMELRTDEYHPADSPHNPNSLYQAVTLAILDTSPQLTFVQLHGFDASWRDTDAVFSDGRVEPQIWSNKLRELWGGHEWKVLVFGRQFKGLGAITNVQGTAINAQGGRFIHIEMSLEMRRWMVKSAKNRLPFVRALIELAGQQ